MSSVIESSGHLVTIFAYKKGNLLQIPTIILSLTDTDTYIAQNECVFEYRSNNRF